MSDFRTQLLATLRAIKPVLDIPGVMVIGSEVPNLLEDAAAATLVVSRDVDVVVPTDRHREVKHALRRVSGLHPAKEEPSVWEPDDSNSMLELNIVGMNRQMVDPTGIEVLDDDELPLLVFGALNLLRPKRIDVDNELSCHVPEPAGLLLEKLLTERSGRKGDRDLLVAAGILVVANDSDLQTFVLDYGQLPADLQHDVRANLTLLSLIEPVPGMPDPVALRSTVIRLLRRLESLSSVPPQ